MGKVRLSPPWEEYISKLECLFEGDDEIHVERGEDYEVKIFVDDTDKCEALTELLPKQKAFGTVVLKITIVPANEGVTDKRRYLKKLFRDNVSVASIVDAKIGTNTMTFIEFEKDVVQYYNDNIGDLHGNRTTVMEEIARDIFDGIDGVSFCTSNII